MKNMKYAVNKFQAAALPSSNIKPIVLAGLALLAVLTSMYVYFVGKIVFDVVGRRTAESTIEMAQSSVSQLQVAYFDKTRTLTMADAASIGLTESHDTLYASRPDASADTVGFLTN